MISRPDERANLRAVMTMFTYASLVVLAFFVAVVASDLARTRRAMTMDTTCLTHESVDYAYRADGP